MVQDCGYNSGRGTEWFEGLCAPLCAESIPPADPYATRRRGMDPTGSRPSRTGSWIQRGTKAAGFSCCSTVSAPRAASTGPPATFNSFLNWLQPRAPSGTTVRTVQQVFGGDGAAGRRPGRGSRLRRTGPTGPGTRASSWTPTTTGFRTATGSIRGGITRQLDANDGRTLGHVRGTRRHERIRRRRRDPANVGRPRLLHAHGDSRTPVHA